MTKLKKDASTDKELAYAELRVLGPNQTKKKSALQVGYTETTANSVMAHVEKKQGFQNAVFKLANKSNGLALAAMKEFEARGFKDFSNKDLVGALSAIGQAWERFNNYGINEGLRNREDDGKNKLRTVILQKVENQTINNK